MAYYGLHKGYDSNFYKKTLKIFKQEPFYIQHEHLSSDQNTLYRALHTKFK